MIALLLTWAWAAEPKPDVPTGPMRGEISSGDVHGLSGDFPFGDGTGSFSSAGRIELRYSMFPLLGEPVWSFEARTPRITRLELETSKGRVEVRQAAAEGSIRWRPGSHTVIVPPEVMSLARITGFDMQLNTVKDRVAELEPVRPGGYGWLHPPFTIHRRYPGLVAPPGEWGWDVPGSPSWDETFSHGDHRMERDESNNGKLHSAEHSRFHFLVLLWNYHRDGREPITRFLPYNFEVDVSALLAAIGAEAPGALDQLYGRGEYSADRQVGAMIDLLRLQQVRDGDERDRVRRLVKRAVDTFRDDLSPATLHRWREARAVEADAALASRVESEGEQLAGALRDVAPGESVDTRDIEALGTKARRSGASSAMRARIRAMERVADRLSEPDPDADITVRLAGREGVDLDLVVTAPDGTVSRLDRSAGGGRHAGDGSAGQGEVAWWSRADKGEYVVSVAAHGSDAVSVEGEIAIYGQSTVLDLDGKVPADGELHEVTRFDFPQGSPTTYCVGGFDEFPKRDNACGAPPIAEQHGQWHWHTAVAKGDTCWTCWDENDGTCSSAFLEDHPEFREVEARECRYMRYWGRRDTILFHVVRGRDQ